MSDYIVMLAESGIMLVVMLLVTALGLAWKRTRRASASGVDDGRIRLFSDMDSPLNSGER